jgi:hypothetical protein
VNEITAAMDDASDEVFGVISTQAAYLMNGGAGSDASSLSLSAPPMQAKHHEFGQGALEAKSH